MTPVREPLGEEDATSRTAFTEAAAAYRADVLPLVQARRVHNDGATTPSTSPGILSSPLLSLRPTTVQLPSEPARPARRKRGGGRGLMRGTRRIANRNTREVIDPRLLSFLSSDDPAVPTDDTPTAATAASLGAGEDTEIVFAFPPTGRNDDPGTPAGTGVDAATDLGTPPSEMSGDDCVSDDASTGESYEDDVASSDLRRFIVEDEAFL